MRKNPSVFNALGFFYGCFLSSNVMNNGKFDNIGARLSKVLLKQGSLLRIRATAVTLSTLCDYLRIKEITR
ncbi:hypothetical protein PDY_21760 [Photobacterium damselae subsp. damselae]|nr:hypothetical protein PDY_21760 [Photobacterium damselae subsp. damselae]